MMNKTHLALGLGVALYFLPYVANKLFFFPTVLVASLLPNAGALISFRRTHRIAKYIKENFNRGFSHAYTLCMAVSIFFAFFYPIAALPFFLGYSFHLSLDVFTQGGIRPFWPLRKKIAGKIKTGGTIDATLFYVFLLIDAALFVKLFI